MELEKEYRLHETFETENAITRIWVPVNQTQEEKEQVLRDFKQAAYNLSLELYKQGKLKRVATS